ncbi:elongation factor G-like protein EF-G2 [Nocardioides pacificus]
MADKGTRRNAIQNLEAGRPDQIRNVVLVGPASSGKTSLVEALLVQAGALSRPGSVIDGTTVSDFEDSEQAHGRSSSLAVAPLVHRGVKVNLLDTPGYADFVGEVRAGLRAADCALFVLAANEGVDHAATQLWAECAEVGMPRVVVVTKLDHPRADFTGVLTAAQAAFGDKVLPVLVPDGGGTTSLLRAGPAVAGAGGDPRRGALIEAVIEESEDEGLMERYLAGEEVSEDALVADLERAVAGASLHPVLPVCATTGAGCDELLELMVRGFPSPAEHRPPEVFTTAGAPAEALACDPDGPLVAEVVKTTSDPYLGRVSLVRVFSGTLEADAALHVSGHFTSFYGEGSGHQDHDDDERIGALGHPFGRQQVAVKRVVAGDIAAIGRLSGAETGDTLSAVDQPRVLRPWAMPAPLLPIAIEAATKSDEDKLSVALARLSAEDPSLRIEQSPETRQLVLWVMGEAHADLALDRLRDRFGVSVEQREVLVPLRETFVGKGVGHGRHVKQSGGHGQYAVCDIEVEPLPGGSGFEFVDKVVGGAVPRQYVPSVEKGVRAQMERGVLNGYPVVDLRVTLTDGKSHSVDSSDMAFQSAGALALREAAADAGVTVLEPYDEVLVRVPDDQVGAVMGDLAARRGRPLGSEQTEDRHSVIRAHVPALELVRYAIDLRAATHGTGTFTRTFDHYEPMPDGLVGQVADRG